MEQEAFFDKLEKAIEAEKQKAESIFSTETGSVLLGISRFFKSLRQTGNLPSNITIEFPKKFSEETAITLRNIGIELSEHPVDFRESSEISDNPNGAENAQIYSSFLISFGSRIPRSVADKGFKEGFVEGNAFD